MLEDEDELRRRFTEALDPNSYSNMWTTERDQWSLYKTRTGHAIVRKRGGPLIIEIDWLYKYIIQKMLEAGVEVIDISDVNPSESQ